MKNLPRYKITIKIALNGSAYTEFRKIAVNNPDLETYIKKLPREIEAGLTHLYSLRAQIPTTRRRK